MLKGFFSRDNYNKKYIYKHTLHGYAFLIFKKISEP